MLFNYDESSRRIRRTILYSRVSRGGKSDAYRLHAIKDHSKWAPLQSNLINKTGAATGINELSLCNENTCQVSEHNRENLVELVSM